MMSSCHKCKVRFKRQELIIECSGYCQEYFHINCVNITKNQLEMIEENESIKWFCDKCQVKIQFTNDIAEEIKAIKSGFHAEMCELKKTILERTQDINPSHVSGNVKQKTYAQVTEAIVIKPKITQECTKTKEDIRESLDPTLLEIGISQVKDSKDGSIIISCNNKEDVEKIKNVAGIKLNENYVIRAQERKNPKIKIVDLEHKLSDVSLIDSLKKQNGFLNHEDLHLKIIVVKKMVTRFMAIVECDPISFERIMTRKRLNIGWVSCRVFEYIPVLRCYKCGEFGHMAESCKNKERCLKCGGEGHKMENCNSEGNLCINCCSANVKHNLNLKTDHFIFDVICPSYRRIAESLKRYIKPTI